MVEQRKNSWLNSTEAGSHTTQKNETILYLHLCVVFTTKPSGADQDNSATEKEQLQQSFIW